MEWPERPAPSRLVLMRAFRVRLLWKKTYVQLLGICVSSSLVFVTLRGEVQIQISTLMPWLAEHLKSPSALIRRYRETIWSKPHLYPLSERYSVYVKQFLGLRVYLSTCLACVGFWIQINRSVYIYSCVSRVSWVLSFQNDSFHKSSVITPAGQR